jgi:hypothetical protein
VPLRGAEDILFRPAGVADNVDGTNSFEGAMEKLRNLIPSYHTPGTFVPRPAATPAVDLSSINAAGVVSALLVIGTRAYGMVSSVTYAGKDQPFCYDLAASAFITIGGLASARLPNTPNSIGNWTPPNMVAVTNSLTMLTHPGFTGGINPYLGWIDVSSYVSSGLLGNTTSGSAVLTGIFSGTIGNSAPILAGVQPGQAITGAGIPAGTYVVSATNGTFSLNTTGSTTNASTSVTAVGSTAGVLPGMTITGPGIPVGTYVTVVGAGTFTISNAATATAAGVAINLSGGGTITMSANATVTASTVAVTATGGTPAAPLWGSGNLNTNPLSVVPTCCYGFNGRAYIGAGAYLVFSDVLAPLQVSLASQALTIGDNTPITAIAGVPLTSQLTGGIQQSMTVFKGAGPLTQITGDAATGDLKQNTVAGSIGTLAPLSIAGTPLGTAYMAVDGLRVVGFSGTVSDPIGTSGTGVNRPFLNALYPSRMCADFGENVYRITVQNTVDVTNPFEEYWFDFTEKNWTGPHSCAARAVRNYAAAAAFLMAPVAVNGVIWRSDVLPRVSSTYTENGVALAWTYRTTLLPDNQKGQYNRVSQSSLACSLNSGDTMTVSLEDDIGALLGSVVLPTLPTSVFYYGTAVYGSATYGAGLPAYREVPVKWLAPLVFRQARVNVTCASAAGQAVGNFYAKRQAVRINTPLR